MLGIVELGEGMEQQSHAQGIFNILVIATVSAGKSTLVNTLFGCDLLPIANEPTTAKIFCLKNCPQSIQPICRAVSFTDDHSIQENWENATAETLQGYNEMQCIDYVEIKAKAYSQAVCHHKFSIYDVPGPNTHEHGQHKKYLYHVLEKIRINQIVYIIDATNAKTLDEISLLESCIFPYTQKHRDVDVIFILNKIDNLDDEYDGALQNIIDKTRSRLESIGFVDPQIMPVMARYAFILRRIQAGATLTKKEHRDVSTLQKRLPKRHNILLKHAHLDSSIKNELLSNLKYRRDDGLCQHQNLGHAFRIAFRKKTETFIQETCVPALERYIHMRASLYESKQK